LGGLSTLALALSDLQKRRDADSLLLGLWVVGTFVFATFVNWTVNARAVLPLIPAVAILIARRIDLIDGASRSSKKLAKYLVPLAAAAIVSLWVTSADVKLANAGREAAEHVRDHARPGANVSFEGHWGFQYYMQRFGFVPVEFKAYDIQDGDLLVIPENNTNTQPMRSDLIASRSMYLLDVNVGVTTIRSSMGAGFYSDAYGPLPYAFGPVRPERYAFIRLMKPAGSQPR
jgi:hypothetical protein